MSSPKYAVTAGYILGIIIKTGDKNKTALLGL